MANLSKSRSLPKLSALPAMGLLGAAATTADAAILYTEVPGGMTIGPDSAIYFDLTQTSSGEFFSNIPEQVQNRTAALHFQGKTNTNPAIVSLVETGILLVALQVENDLHYAMKFDSGAFISSSLIDFSINDSPVLLAKGDLGPWAGGATNKYLGLAIQSPDPDIWNYGWAEVSYSPGSLTLHGFAYETDANTPITAGAIPEPSSVALLALAAGAGALGLRRRKKA